MEGRIDYAKEKGRALGPAKLVCVNRTRQD
jgi:hypothetical protein